MPSKSRLFYKLMPAFGSWWFSILCAAEILCSVPKKHWGSVFRPALRRSRAFRLKAGAHQFILLISVLTLLCPRTRFDFAVCCLRSSQINVSWQNTKCSGQCEIDWSITRSADISIPHLRPANIPAYTPAPPKILCGSYFLFIPLLLSL